MALNGFRSSEDRRTRLIKTSIGLLAIYKVAPGVSTYSIYNHGVLLGSVVKADGIVKGWIPIGMRQNGKGGKPCKTRQEAIEKVIADCPKEESSGKPL